MKVFTVIISHACFAMAAAHGNEFDMVLDKMLDRALDVPTHLADLDQTTLGKTAVGATAGTRVQIFPPASSMRGMSQVQAMQNTLQKYGIGSSPMQKLALTQLAATRDPSMKAQVREAFSELDPKSQEKVRSASKEVVVRASAFESLKKEDMPGVTVPLGFWDPLKLSTDAPEGRLYFYREAELKNGRTAMMAVLGLLVTQKLGFRPFYEGAEPYSSPVASHFSDAIAAHFWPSLGIACGLAEMFSYPDGSKAPGDLGFDPLGLKPKDEKDFKALQDKEINNGRLAMMAYAGIVGKELLTGSSI
jgi:light-harvesting complex I chlorophyll a/b binding protein 1